MEDRQGRERDNAPVDATVRVAGSAPAAAPGESTALQIGRNLGWLEDVRRFLVANGYAVRYTEDRIALLLIDPWVEAVVDGKAVLRDQPAPVPASDRSLDQAPMPVPADHRWMRMFWEEWYAGLNGIGSAEDVRDAIAYSAQQDVPAVVGGDGSIWFGATLYSPEHTAPPVKWERFAVPSEFARTYPWNSTVREDCAAPGPVHRGVLREGGCRAVPFSPGGVVGGRGGGGERAGDTAVPCGGQRPGRGPGVAPGRRADGAHARPGNRVRCGARHALPRRPVGGRPGGRAGPGGGRVHRSCLRRPGPGVRQGFYLEPAGGDGAVRIVLAVDGRIIGLPNSDVLTA
ncbi:hypothetical protein [Kitasatospora sp. NPDC088548]|uniref:hypothetical protein n=1 Tax=Kitasatospora sp. NPDC088548 TaxID=3364075 RepID=UPI0037FF2183